MQEEHTYPPIHQHVPVTENIEVKFQTHSRSDTSSEEEEQETGQKYVSLHLTDCRIEMDGWQAGYVVGRCMLQFNNSNTLLPQDPLAPNKYLPMGGDATAIPLPVIRLLRSHLQKL